MKRNFTLLTIMGALIAMAVPASSMANVGVYPPSHSFEISGATMPSISGSLAGSCTLGKITGTVPAQPINVNETSVRVPIATPTASCTAGVSVTLAASPNWALIAQSRTRLSLVIPGEMMVLRYTSLPGCKLVSSGGPTGSTVAGGFWSNGLLGANGQGVFSRPSYRADGAPTGVWAADGGSCAMTGKTEALTYRTESATTPTALVKDTTVPTTNILIGNDLS